MKRVSGGALLSLPVGLFLASKSSTGPPFSSPLWSLIVNSTRTNFSPHWKKMCCVLQVCFWIKAALGQVFLSPLRPHAFWIYWDKFFCSCGSVFAQKQHWKTLFLWVCFFGVKQHWTRCETEKISGWAGEKFAGWKKIEELLVRIFDNFALQISRLGDLGICVFATEKVWGGEGEKICRWEEDKILYSKKMRGWDHVEELKVFGQEYI